MSGQAWRAWEPTADRLVRKRNRRGERSSQPVDHGRVRTRARDLSRHPTPTRHLARAHRHDPADRHLVAAPPGRPGPAAGGVLRAGGLRAGTRGHAQPDRASARSDRPVRHAPDHHRRADLAPGPAQRPAVRPGRGHAHAGQRPPGRRHRRRDRDVGRGRGGPGADPAARPVVPVARPDRELDRRVLRGGSGRRSADHHPQPSAGGRSVRRRARRDARRTVAAAGAASARRLVLRPGPATETGQRDATARYVQDGREYHRTKTKLSG